MLRRKNSMNKLRIFLLLIIITIVLTSLNVNSAFLIRESSELINAYNNNNLLRLHVIANSNSVRDQYIKRLVRDKVINYLAESSDKELVLSDLESVKKYIEGILHEEGFYQGVKVETGKFYFPERTYDELTLPAGEYKALRIILGRGEGANWWCVLLPPLCIDKEQSIDQSNHLEFKFKVLELFKTATRKIKISNPLGSDSDASYLFTDLLSSAYNNFDNIIGSDLDVEEFRIEDEGCY
ncbi:MAG: hypothetical protein FH762_17045 [Firmicutes bacterium]|nr:hypothetical protein [Bacillota bacterium]